MTATANKFMWEEGDLKSFPLTLKELRSKKPLTDAEPRQLYVRRNVLNADAIRKHYKAIGFDLMTPAEQMHVTVIYTINNVDWMKVEDEHWSEDDQGGIRVKPGGPRMHDIFGPGFDSRAFVLMFSSSVLAYRHMRIKNDVGAEVSFPEYQPHITLTYQPPADIDPDDYEPYRGEILLGPEIFENPIDDFRSTFKEDAKPKAKVKRSRKIKVHGK